VNCLAVPVPKPEAAPMPAPAAGDAEPAEEMVWHVDEDNCVLGAVPRSRMVCLDTTHIVVASVDMTPVCSSARRSCGIVPRTSLSSIQRENCMCSAEPCARITVQVIRCVVSLHLSARVHACVYFSRLL
jgi:hypothetical protein